MPDIHFPHSPRFTKVAETAVPDQRWETAVAAAVLALTVTLVFAPWIFLGKAFYWGDIGLFFLPLNHFLKESLSIGAIPLWNPYLFCGAPFVGNPQVSVFYPSTLLLPMLPTVTAIMIAEVVHIFAAGLFFWLFARRGSLRLDFLPSLLAAVTYMLGGYFVAKAQFPNMLAALAYVPLLLYQTELLVVSPTFRRSAIFGSVLGLQLLAAHAQIVVFTLYLLAPYAFLVYFSSNERHKFLRVLGIGIAGGFIAAGLACVYWLPVAELIHSSARQALTLKIANRFYLPTYEVGNFVLPHLYGSPMGGDWHAHGNYWETDNYVGIAPFLLAVAFVGMAFRKPSSIRAENLHRIFWGVVFVVSLVLSFGVAGGLYNFAFDVLPALSAFHDPARFMLGANIALSLFAGGGLQLLLSNQQLAKRIGIAIVLIGISIIDLGWQDRGIYPLKSVVKIVAMAHSPIASMIASQQSGPGASRIEMPDSRKTWQSFTTYKKYESNDSSFLSEWPDTLSPCIGMTYSIREVEGYDPEYRRDSQELVDLAQQPLNDSKANVPQNLAHYLSILGVKYLVTYRVDPVNAPGLTQVFQSAWTRQGRKVTVYRNIDYSSRASTYSHWINVQNQTQALNYIGAAIKRPIEDDDFDLPPVERLSSRDSPLMPVALRQAGSPATFVRDTPDDVKLITKANIQPSVLILADTLHPGWTATVDGSPAKIYRANVDQRAVFLAGSDTPKRHTVEFRYRPVDFLFGFYVSLATLSLFLSVIIGTSRLRQFGN